MRRRISVVLVSAVCSGLSGGAFQGDGGVHDPAFDKVPFAEWLSDTAEGRLKWSKRTLPVTLSAHLRLLARVQIEIAGAELAKRRGAGKLIFYFQFSDSKGRRYQDHTEYDLERAETSLKGRAVTISESAFVVPGDYSVTFAIYDTASGEHAARQEILHVLPMSVDPLPDAWRDLPAVDFVDASEPPDSWFLPKALGQLNLRVDAGAPVRVDVVANLTDGKDGDVSVLLPYLKVLSQLKGSNVTKNFSVLDLKRRRVIFEQRDVEGLDWDRLRSSVMSVNSGLIDRASLANRREVAAYFAGQIARRFESSEQKIVIVLSGAMAFDAKQARPQVEIKPSLGDRLFYIRMRSAPRLGTMPEDMPEPTSRQLPRGPSFSSPDRDELAHIFAVPGLRLFDVQSPEVFLLVLADIVGSITR